MSVHSHKRTFDTTGCSQPGVRKLGVLPGRIIGKAARSGLRYMANTTPYRPLPPEAPSLPKNMVSFVGPGQERQIDSPEPYQGQLERLSAELVSYKEDLFPIIEIGAGSSCGLS